MAEKKYIRVRYVKSSIGYNQRQKDTVKSLGLRKLGQEKIHLANNSIIGMCKAVQHLVKWEDVTSEEVK